MYIRNTESSDRESIQQIYCSAFPESERDVVSQVAVDLLTDESTPRVISLVAEIESELVGHVAFSPVTDMYDGSLLGYLLAPLAVAPSHQKQGIGSALIQCGMQQLSQRGIEVLLVYGDPAYYSRFGFSTDTAERYVPPYELQYSFGWQGLVLNDQDTTPSPVTIACVPCLCDPALW
ncbi:MAG: GNAT family N-acetyltransferase [Planctomycetota bacterium]|jgi:putative acetyltransferase